MTKFLTVVLFLMISSVAMALDGGTHPIPLKERLKWDLWVNGVDQKVEKSELSQQQIPEEIEQVLRNFNL